MAEQTPLYIADRKHKDKGERMKVLQNIKIALKRRMTRRHHCNSEAENASYVDLTRTLVKCALDNSKWEYQFDKEEDCFWGILPLDDTTEVILALKPRANYIHAQSSAVKRPVVSLKLTDALLFCNKWNSKSLFPKAYIDRSNNTLIAETVMTIGEETSEEFVRECLLKNLLAANITFFEEAVRCDFLPECMSES